MHQFPKWKYWLVTIVVLAGLLFALPNVFLQDAALQVGQTNRQLKMDAPAEQKVRDILQAKNLPVKRSHFEGERLVLSFATEDLQKQARDAIEASAAKEYTVVLASTPGAPRWMLNLGLKPMGLGLDLRGGIHFMYEVDIQAAVSQTFDRLERDVRQTLRDKRISYVNVVNGKGSLTLTLREASDLGAAKAAIEKIEQGLVLSVDDSASSISITLSPENIRDRQTGALQQNITTLRSRVNELGGGVSEPVVQQLGKDRIVVELPGLQDPIEAKRVLGSTATLEWHMVDEANDPYTAASTKRIPVGSKLYTMRDGGAPILLKRELIVAAEQMADAQTNHLSQSGLPAVSITLDSAGGAAMLKNTQQNIGKRMGVLYIEKKHLAAGEPCVGVQLGEYCTQESVISAATIQGVFGSKFEITGLGASEARELALLLRAGSLATPMYQVEQRVIGPSLGKENIEKGVTALVAGLLLTFLFMGVYYKAFGIVANVVLFANIVLLAGLLSAFGAALSLPGIAGLVLTVGMAVDANILIYERIREELRLGNSPQASINAGFEKAFSAIADSNVTTLIAGVVLLAIGTGPIKGFAVVLTLGIVTSMFTAIVGSRALVHLIWGRRAKLTRLSI
jgi:preprotein translocase subunit SecD